MAWMARARHAPGLAGETIQPTGRVRVCITCLRWCEISELVTCQSGYGEAELVVRGEKLLSGPARS